MNDHYDNESLNIEFDSVQPQPCYSAKLFPELDEVQIHKGRKCIARFKQSSFPKNLDFNNPGDISKILKIVRENGTLGLLQEFNLKLIS